MFTINHQPSYEINLNQIQEGKLEIVNTNFEIGHEFSEEIVFRDRCFNIFFFDKNGNHKKLECYPTKVKTIPAKYIKDYAIYYRPDKMGHIWEVKNSKFIHDMKQRLDDDEAMVDNLNNSKHYILPFKDNLIEIVAVNTKIKTLDTSKTLSDLLLYRSIKSPREQKIINWSLFKGSEVIFEDHHIQDAIEVKISDFKTCTTPLEEFIFNSNDLIIYLDDKDEIRHKITFKNCKKIEFTNVDCARCLTNYYGSETYRHILEDEKSAIIQKLKEYVKKPSELEKLQHVKHFALPLQDNLIEIIAEDISIEQAE
ncbi:MAG: hypothetical protein IJG00_05580 [Clostridia bacterium]|nr:hypothetical protein [Clostridia bacterium]